MKDIAKDMKIQLGGGYDVNDGLYGVRSALWLIRNP